GFYNAVRTEVGKTQPEAGKKPEAMVSVGSISTTMMAGLRLQSQMPSPDSVYNKTDPYKGFTNFNIAMNQLGGSALFLVSAFAFFSAAFLFITRFIALLFYMLFSPVAFLGILAPEMFKEYSSKWWKGLQSQAIFAPVFLFIVYLISSIINSGKLWEAVGGSSNPAADFYDAFSSSGQGGSFPIIMNYVILIALMIGGLIAAKAMAAQGSAGMVAYADKVRGWAQGVAGRNTVGRAAYLANKSDFVNNLTTESPFWGGLTKKNSEKRRET
ncbi:MAG: hypothetical protein KGI39_00600, partial [Patescibacteria group bacterium]|nr:hypothetical protein [Patescibacteria group bacterium]